MKKRSKLKKGLAILLSLAMVVGLVPGVGTMKVSAEEEGSATSSTVTFEATAGTAVANENEGYDKLIDGKYSSDDENEWSKWCVTDFSGAYIIFASSEPISVKGYTIVTGNDNDRENGRNPKNWTLYGCNDADANSEAGKDSESWVLIHSVENDTVLEDKNYTSYKYDLDEHTSTKYQYFKLEIAATQGSNVMQMSEFILDYTTCEHTWEKGDTVAPTCTEEGYTLQTCSKCNEQQKIEIKPALGHDFNDNDTCNRCNSKGVVPSKPAGEGTVISPYKISTVGELYWFAGLVNGDESVCTGGVTQNKSANAVLTADIIVNRDLLTSLKYDSDNNVTNGSDFTSWTSIGWARWVEGVYVENPYTGTFDGQGHTVSGLYFNDTNEDYVGLFGYVGSGGSVSNVGIVDSYFNGKQCVGGVCGENQGTITNCYNTGTVTGTGDYVGGVCGRNIGTITSCYNTGTVTGTGYYVGGVCGDNYTENNGTATITNCYNIGKVSGSSSVGGVCGRIDGTITNCYNTGAVSASGNNPKVGGVCGFLWSGNIINCYYDKDKCNVKGMTNDSETIDVTGQAEGKTTEQFAGGEVAYLLSQGCTIGESENQIVYEGSCWEQKLGEAGDAYPVLKKTGDEGNTVYGYTNCKQETAYTNDITLSGTTGRHDYSAQGVCNICSYNYSQKDLTEYVSSLSEVAEENYSDATFAVYSNAKTEAENLAGETADASAADLYRAYCELKSAYEALKPAALIVGTVANPSDTGKQTGGGKYAVGETVTLTAEGVNDWTFNGWYDSEKKLISDKAEVTFTVTEDMSGTVSYTAKYTHISHTMDAETHKCRVCGIDYYKVAFTGAVTSETYTTGNVEFPAGDYIFKVGDDVIDTSDYMVSADTTITVESLAEAGKYAVTITGDAHCTLTVTDSNGNTVVSGDTVAAGTILKVSVKVDDGYTLTTTPESSYTVSEATTITAVTEAKTYAVTVDDTYYKSGEAGAPTASVYVLSAVPYGTSLTLTAADANSGYEFLGWYQTNGKQLTAEREYTVTITSALTVQPRYQKNSGTVTFVANNSVVGTFTGTSITEGNFPETPVAPSGYEFDSWDKTVTEINTLLEDNNVTVTATFKKIANSFTVSVYNGNATEPENTAYEETTRVIVTAQDVTGMNFAYWTLNGEIQSYNKTVSFYTSSDCVIKAVYSDVVTTAKGTATLQTGNYDLSTKRLSMVCYLTVPDDCTMVKAGVIAASGNSNKYNAQDELTMDNADYVKTGSNLSGLTSLTYTWIKSNVSVGDTWYARAYVTYTDSRNNTVTVYGDRITLNAGTDYDYTEKASAKINSVSWDASTKRATFASYITVPDGAVMEKAGVVVANSSAYNPETAILTTENATYVKSGTNLSSLQTLTYTWIKSNVSSGDIWYARAYVIYTDESGVSHTVYGNIIKYQAK